MKTAVEDAPLLLGKECLKKFQASTGFEPLIPVQRSIAPCQGNLDSGIWEIFPFANPGHWALESRTDSVLWIRNPTNDWNPETKTTYNKGSGIRSVRPGIHSEEFRIQDCLRLPYIITYQPIGAGHAWRWINEDMYTPLAHFPRHNAPYLPLKVLHKPLFSISLGTYVMPMGNEKKIVMYVFYENLSPLNNTTPEPKRGTGWACTNVSLPVKILEIFQL